MGRDQSRDCCRKEVVNELSKEILAGKIAKNARIEVQVVNGRIRFEQSEKDQEANIFDIEAQKLGEKNPAKDVALAGFLGWQKKEFFVP